jgi:hypothetical protein
MTYASVNGLQLYPAHFGEVLALIMPFLGAR